MIKWAYEPVLRRRRLRRERLEKAVSKVIATTTVRPCLAAAIIEFARTDFHRWVEWVAERMETNELYWRGTEHVCEGFIGEPVVVWDVVIHSGCRDQEGWWAGQKPWCVIG